jgi:hypothetical protein
MSIIDQDMLWSQFGASIDMLGSAIRDCPDELWQTSLWKDEPGQFVAQGFSAYWYLCYHTLFWLDLYLTGAEEGFLPPEPFDLVEMEEGETLPRVYSKVELLQYLEICRQRTRETIYALTPEAAKRVCSFGWGAVPFGELLLYNFRHVQEHASQLLLFLGQHSANASGWEPRAS